MKKVWLIDFPVSRYNEDVKALARKNDLVIYDAKFKDAINPELVEDNPPKLTIKGEKKRRAKKVEEKKAEIPNTEEPKDAE
jgi:hypothetical protein